MELIGELGVIEITLNNKVCNLLRKINDCDFDVIGFYHLDSISGYHEVTLYDETTGLRIPTGSTDLRLIYSDVRVVKVTFKNICENLTDARNLIAASFQFDEFNFHDYMTRFVKVLTRNDERQRISDLLTSLGIMTRQVICYNNSSSGNSSSSIFSCYDNLYDPIVKEVKNVAQLKGSRHLRLKLKSFDIVSREKFLEDQLEFMRELRDCFDNSVSRNGVIDLREIINILNSMLVCLDIEPINCSLIPSRESGLFLSLEKVIMGNREGSIFKEFNIKIIRRIISWLEHLNEPDLYELENNLLVEYSRRSQNAK